MLYTGKGDDGTTGLFGSEERVSKSSPIIEALGTLDELNSLLGICKLKAKMLYSTLPHSTETLSQTIALVQHTLFTIQAELGGAEKKITKEKIDEMEGTISSIEKTLPPIKTFVLSGGTELAALLDYSRAIARRAERNVIAASNTITVSKETKIYLNRLSTLLYACARFVNAKMNIKETPPTYM